MHVSTLRTLFRQCFPANSGCRSMTIKSRSSYHNQTSFGNTDFQEHDGSFQKVAISCDLSKMFGKIEPGFSTSVRVEMEQTLPTTKMSLYSYSKSSTTYYYSFKKETFLRDEGTYNPAEFIEGFKIFSSELQLFRMGKATLFLTEHPFLELGPVINEQGFDYHVTPLFGYIMTEEQEKMLLKEPLLPLPEGYSLGNATMKDVVTFVDHYPHKDSNIEMEIEQTKAKLRAFPSSVVRFQDKPVAWEYVYTDGQQNNLHVLKEHRNKGLGHVVERDLAIKLIKEGRPVFKSVVTTNEKFVRASDRSPLWTKHNLPDGRRWRPDDVHVYPKDSKR